MISVFLADDHTVVRDGLRFLLDAQTDITVVGDAADGHEAVRRAVELRPDVVVMDIAMPRLNGIEATRQIRDDCPDVEIIILSMHVTAEHVYRALQAGAQGYLVKESAGAEVVEAVRAVGAGRRYLARRIMNIVVESFMKLGEEETELSPLERLSPRERDVLQLVVEGHTSTEIAERLALSSSTVETYRSRLMKKLGIKDIPSLVKFAIQHGITPLD